MSENEHSEIVERLFHQALACDAASRADFLAAKCGGDVAVMADVASLLTAYENDEHLLKRPAFQLTASEMAASVLDAECWGSSDDARVSGYALVREIGRGGMKLAVSEIDRIAQMEGDDLVALDEAMRRLARLYPQKSRVVELRFFGGLSIEETAGVLQVSDSTVERDWKFARAWLARELNRGISHE